MEKFVTSLNAYLTANSEEKKILSIEIINNLEALKSPEVDDSFKDGVKENLVFQMENNLLTSKEIGEHLMYLIMLKFQ